MANVKYTWVAKSDDSCYDVQGNVFDTKQECYEDMRNAALEKMKWNTQYVEDFDWENGEVKEDDNNCIGYEVSFMPHKIIHKSYSGTYTYEIKPMVYVLKHSDPDGVIFTLDTYTDFETLKVAMWGKVRFKIADILRAEPETIEVNTTPDGGVKIAYCGKTDIYFYEKID